MRIGIFSNAYKPDISGVVTSICTFRDELVRQGHAVYIFAPESGDYEDEDYGIFRYPSVKLTSAVNIPMAIPVSPFINWVAPRLKLDVLHSQHPFLIGEEAVTFAKQLGLPHVFTHHSQYEEYSSYIPFNQNIVKTFTREVVRGHMMRSVRIITPSESIQKMLVEQYPEIADRFRVVPSPVNLELFDPGRLRPDSIRHRYGLKGKFVFIVVARLSPEKQFPVLLEAFQSVVAAHTRVHLLIVGGGRAKDDLEKLTQRLGLTQSVTFAGLVDFEDVPHHLAAADAFAFPSTSETQGLVLAEGMAAGLPVVAVDAPGNRDVVQHEVNGLLTENSPEALAAGMVRLLENPDLCRAYADKARKTADGYAPAVLATRLIEYYAEAIERYARQPLTYKRFARDQDSSRQFPPQWFTDIKDESVESLITFWEKISRYWSNGESVEKDK